MNETAVKNVPAWEEIVRENVKSLRFGVVQIVVHENRVVQIERTEKVRLERGVENRQYESSKTETYPS